MRSQTFSDDELRRHIKRGLTVSEIAAIYSLHNTTVSRRVRRLGIVTQAIALQPAEGKRYVNRQINAHDHLIKGLDKVNLLMDACDEWLRDAHDPSKYDIGPRAKEVDVTYTVEVPTETGYRYEKRKKNLAELLGTLESDEDGYRITRIEKGEYKHADPRELILKTAQEVRSTIDLAADLARLLADYRAMQNFREAVIVAIRRCSPELAAEVAESVQKTAMLHTSLGGIESVTGV